MKDQPSNIFESLAGKRVEKTPASKSHSKEPALQREPLRQELQLSKEEGQKVGNLHPAAYMKKSREESEKMIDQINEMRAQLDDNVKKIYEQTGLSPTVVEKLVESSIPPKLLEDVKKLEKDIQKAFGSTIRVISKAEKTKMTMNKERKGKTLGARKKWIPMR